MKFIIIAAIFLTGCLKGETFSDNFKKSADECRKSCEYIHQKCRDFNVYNSSGELSSIDCENN